MNKEELAIDKHHHGHDCAQSVVCAFAEEMGVDANVAYKLAEGFGRGFGGLQETCGALSGATMVVSYTNSSGLEDAGKSKIDTYQKTAALIEKFKETNGSYICKEMMGKPGHNCDQCIALATRLTEEYLKKK